MRCWHVNNLNKQIHVHHPIRTAIIVLTIFCVANLHIALLHPAYAGEFPNKITKEELKPQEPEQKPKEPEKTIPVGTQQSKKGCLIATAAFGSELTPQVQLLREVRDNVLFSIDSGTTFMTGFNEFYYSFSPTVADWERQSPLFKEAVKTAITPMLYTMSILNYANINSEQQMLGYGIGVILLNIGMYLVAPAFLILGLRKLRKNAANWRNDLA